MSNLSYIEHHLTELGFPKDVVKCYEEPHRFYHTTQHLLAIVSQLSRLEVFDKELFLAAVYHDAVYNPQAKDNEEQSAELFIKDAQNSKLTQQEINTIKQLILDTKTHTPSSEKSSVLIEADLGVFNQSFEQLITYEHQIFKEFQFVDYKTYVNKRIEVLEQFNTNNKLNNLIDYVRKREPKIGVFAGSFNPFHKGHFNVLEKAERIFDKVIIAFGSNPDKQGRTWEIPSTIKNRQITTYDGLLTDFVNDFPYDITVIRGLRNSTDFQYEQNQYRYIQELKPDIKIVNIFCDKEFEHISSSGIRTLEKYNKHEQYLLK